MPVAHRRRLGEERLFDLRSDPDERRNLAAIGAVMADAPAAMRRLPPR